LAPWNAHSNPPPETFFELIYDTSWDGVLKGFTSQRSAIRPFKRLVSIWAGAKYPDMEARKILASGLWRWLTDTGLERFELSHAGQQWTLRGMILTMSESAFEARYHIGCDAQFRTRLVQIELRDSGGARSVEISAEDGRWYLNGDQIESVRGAIDVDLGWSPSTNTLPIRRLGLQVGQSSGEFIAAWVRFPELVLEPLPQEYRRLGEKEYLYLSRGGAFKAKLLVDDYGLVMDYEGFWQRVPNAE
jgi:hypothetical protein